jgi:hypothetical protein
VIPVFAYSDSIRGKPQLFVKAVWMEKSGGVIADISSGIFKLPIVSNHPFEVVRVPIELGISVFVAPSFYRRLIVSDNEPQRIFRWGDFREICAACPGDRVVALIAV